MIKNSFLTEKELKEINFGSLGNNVKISRKASFYNPENIFIGNNSRIDDFCILSAGEGGIKIGKNVHLACYSSLIGQGEIILEDYTCLSSKVSVYSSNEDYSGDSMTNSTIPTPYRKTIIDKVIIKKHSIVCSGSIIMPGVIIEEGVVIGALSLVKNNCEYFWIYAGVPAKKIKRRKEKILILEKEYEKIINEK